MEYESGYQSVETLEKIQGYLGDAALIAFDFETAPLSEYRNVEKAALDAHKAHIVGISLSVKEGTAVYIPLRHQAGRNANPLEVLGYLREAVFENPSVTKIAHNLAFESMFLYAMGIVVQPPCYDTIAAAQLTLKGHMQFRSLSDSGLKLLAASLLSAQPTTFGEVTQGQHFDDLPAQSPEAISYACADSDYTLRLFHLFNGWFDRYLPKHRCIVEQVESPTAVYCGIMKYNGLLMDADAMRQKQTECGERIQALRAQIAGIIGNVDIGANASTSAFKKHLFSTLALPVMKTTAKMQEAADDQTMVLLSEWCAANRPELTPLFEAVQEFRKLGKICSTYIEGYLQHVNPATSRIHSDLMPLATETGRFASRKPNFQNCPRKDNDPVGVRSFIMAPKGKVLLSLDFSQIELRVGAFFCRDERMLETYRQGGDIHAQTTAIVYNIPFAEAADKNAAHYKERRTIAKNCNFGVFFGLFAKGLQRNLRFKAGLPKSLEECEGIIANLKTGYPRLTRWQRETAEKAGRTHYSETWLGRRRYLPGITSEDWAKRSYAERCALNTPIQGTAADILKLALGRIIAGLSMRMWLRPLLQIHDELVFELPEERLHEAVAFVRGCMEMQPFEAFDVPIVAEAAYGTTFGSMAEMEGSQ